MTGNFSGGLGNSNDLPATPLSAEAQAIKDAFTNKMNTAILETRIIDPAGANIKLIFAPSVMMVKIIGAGPEANLPYVIG